MENRTVLITEDYEDEPTQSQVIKNVKLSEINTPKTLKKFLMENIINNYLDVCYDPNKYRTPDLSIDPEKLLPTDETVEEFIEAFNNKGSVDLQNPGRGTDQSLYTFEFK